LNITDVVQPKFVPVMTTLEPTPPLAGVKEVIVGTPAAATMKFAVLTVLPVGASTAIGPLVAPAGTVVVIEVSDATVNVGWLVPLNRTAVAAPPLLNPVPVMVTALGDTPQVGENDEIVAADAGRAVTSTPTTPSVSASAVARADTFRFWKLISGSPFPALERSVGAT